MGRRRNVNIWLLILAFLLTIVGTSGANGETIYCDAYESVRDLAATAQDSNGPTILDHSITTILDHSITTFHDRDSYQIFASANVYDPQGPSDIATVKAIDANGNEFILKLQFIFDYQQSGYDAGHYWAGQSYKSTPLPLGNTQIVAIDQSGNLDTASKNLTNVVEQLPTMMPPTKVLVRLPWRSC